jgi:hypothetical protein
MYAWLDGNDARECGDSLACFWYEHPTEDLIQDITEDLNKSVELDTKRNRIYVIRNEGGRFKGTFVFGRRRNSPWTGVAATGAQEEDNG